MKESGIDAKESATYAKIYAEIAAEAVQECVLITLEERFGKPAAASCRDGVQRVTKGDKLNRLVRLAARCASIEGFQRGTLAFLGRLTLDVMSLIAREQMKESTIYAEIAAEAVQECVLTTLEERFGTPAAASCRDAVERVTKGNKLDRLVRLAARCASIEAFQRGLRAR